uniref:long-chain-fatty-acid--CoA ligase n=1 Tax=Ditylenchus dipsaci TaxID=166011 RepID=A0A915DB78_9BILA
MPKGVMLTHGNINHKDVMISFLPLAHMFERIVQAGLYVEGGSVGFFAGDIKYLAEDIRALRPTVMPVVPKVLSRFHDKVMTQVNKSLISKLLFHTAIKFKSSESKKWIFRNDSFIDRLVFKPIRKGLGGRIKLMATGSAPISNELLNFIRCAVGCLVVEGYGQTECVAVCSVTIEGDFIAGHVGVPSPCNAIKLMDVPELNYFAKNQATTNAGGDESHFGRGWGTLKIIDRKKHIFKLSQGEYVAPEKIENIYSAQSTWLNALCMEKASKVVWSVFVVPERELNYSDSRPCCIRIKVTDNITLEELYAGLATFEQVKDIYLCHKMFTVGTFKDQIEEMYNDIS